MNIFALSTIRIVLKYHGQSENYWANQFPLNSILHQYSQTWMRYKINCSSSAMHCTRLSHKSLLCSSYVYRALNSFSHSLCWWFSPSFHTLQWNSIKHGECNLLSVDFRYLLLCRHNQYELLKWTAGIIPWEIKRVIQYISNGLHFSIFTRSICSVSLIAEMRFRSIDCLRRRLLLVQPKCFVSHLR